MRHRSKVSSAPDPMPARRQAHKAKNAGRPHLSEDDVTALAGFFGFFWAVVALNPRGQQSVRSVMKRLGLVRPTGRLALTSRGERAIAALRFPDESKAKARPKPSRDRRRPLKKSRPVSS